MSPAVSVTDISMLFRKRYEHQQSAKDRAVGIFRKNPVEEFWALRNVNIEIERGETFGLLGANGSGKSTLLKVIAGILSPTTGEVRAVGRLAALLELGAGFHPDLTGRENVFLNAAILGIPRAEIESRMDQIVQFAEIDEFIDTQVKHYSSGMFVRLGFAVAVNLEPDVLLVDEVLAVGDEAFQRKCIDRVRTLQRSGTTIVFVTHSPDLVRQICDRATVLDHGEQVLTGLPGEAIRAYRDRVYNAGEVERIVDGDARTEAGGSSKRVKITDVSFRYPEQSVRSHLLPGDPLAITISYDAMDRVEDVVIGFAFYDEEGKMIFGTNTRALDLELLDVHGKGEVTFDIASVPLLDGTYLLTTGIHNRDGGVVYDWRERDDTFQVMNPSRNTGLVDMGVSVETRLNGSGDQQTTSTRGSHSGRV